MPVDSVWFPRMENLPAVFLFPEKQWRWTPPDLLVEELTEETIEDDETTEEATEEEAATAPDLLVEEMTEETIEDDETTEEATEEEAATARATEAAVAGRRRRCWLRTTL